MQNINNVTLYEEYKKASLVRIQIGGRPSDRQKCECLEMAEVLNHFDPTIVRVEFCKQDSRGVPSICIYKENTGCIKTQQFFDSYKELFSFVEGFLQSMSLFLPGLGKDSIAWNLSSSPYFNRPPTLEAISKSEDPEQLKAIIISMRKEFIKTQTKLNELTKNA